MTQALNTDARDCFRVSSINDKPTQRNITTANWLIEPTAPTVDGSHHPKASRKAGRSRGQGKPKVSEEAKQLALLAQRAAHDTDQLNQLGETDEYSHFNGLFGCTLAVGATKDWVKLNAVGEQLIKEPLKKFRLSLLPTWKIDTPPIAW